MKEVLKLNTSKNSLGKLIKDARKIKSKRTTTRYTQDLLSKDVGVSISYIGDLECGRFTPSYELLIKISKACNLPFTFFAIYNEHIIKRIETKFPNSDFKDNIEIINYYKNSVGYNYEHEFQINGYYNEKKINNYTGSFEEYCSTTLDRIPQIVYDPNVKIAIHKSLNLDPYFGDVPIGDINFQYDLDAKYAYTAFPVSDDGMNLSKISKGDLVIIRRQNHFENGDIVAVKINNSEDLIRRAYKVNTTITLIPNSSVSTYEPRTLDSSEIQIIGKVVKSITNI